MSQRDILIARATGKYNGEPLTVFGYTEGGIRHSAESPCGYAGLPFTFFDCDKEEYLAGLPEGATLYEWPEI